MSITMIGLGTAKSVFQAHAMDAAGQVVIRRKLLRSELLPFFEKQAACTVDMEACGAAHHWARVLTGLGHEVKLIVPEAVRPFVKKGKKNDAADAAGICEAASRPGVRFVPVKSLEQQGVQPSTPIYSFSNTTVSRRQEREVRGVGSSRLLQWQASASGALPDLSAGDRTWRGPGLRLLPGPLRSLGSGSGNFVSR